MPHEDHLIAITPGELHEPAGIVAMTRVETLGAFDERRKRYSVTVTNHVTRIEVLPRSGDFEAMVERVAKTGNHDNAFSKRAAKTASRANAFSKSRHVTLIDVTHAGRAILEPLRAAGIKPTAITISGTIGTKAGWGSVQVGEQELAARVAIVLSEDRLRVDPAMDGSQELAQQLAKFTTGKPARVPTTQQPFVKAERQELVRALALALWYGDRQMAARVDQPIPPPQPIDCSPPTFDQVIKHYARR